MYYFSDPNPYNPHSVPASNPGFLISSGQRPRNYVNQPTHNVSDMKHNHIPNMTHGKLYRHV